MSNSKVKVTADAEGNVIVPSKNSKDWGYIRLTQVRNVVNDHGFAKRKPVSALLNGTIEDLKSFGYQKDQEIDGIIIFKESLIPFNPKNPEKDYKIAGETKIVCVIDGSPIYRRSFYSQNENAKDALLEHTNGNDVKAAFQAIKAGKVETEPDLNV